MNQDSRNGLSRGRGMGRFLTHLWKRVTLTVIAAIMVLAVTGCDVDDYPSAYAGDVPFEQGQTPPSEMGALDDTLTVPDDAAFDNLELRPLN